MITKFKQLRQTGGSRAAIPLAGTFLAAVVFASLGGILAVESGLVRGNPAARLLEGEFAYERWEMTTRFQTGELFFAEFLITNLGIGDRNAALVGHIIGPGERSRKFRTGRREKRWHLSNDRLRVEVGRSWLDQRGLKNSVRIEKKRVRVGLDYYRGGDASWSTDFAPAGYAIDLLDPAAQTEGTLWVEGMAVPVGVKGSMAVTHSWAETAESNLLARQFEFFTLPNEQDKPAIYLADLLQKGGARSNWLVARIGSETIWEKSNFNLTTEGNFREIRDYPIPEKIDFDAGNVQGEIRLLQPILEYDPLDDVPQPFRFLLSIKIRPRRVWIATAFRISFRAGPTTQPEYFTGTGVTKVYFMNPSSDSGLSRASLPVQRLLHLNELFHARAYH